MTNNIHTMVTICEPKRICIKLSLEDDAEKYTSLGFTEVPDYERLYQYLADDIHITARMCETLRDMGIPFAFHRTGGADYFLENLFMKKGIVSGVFKRIIERDAGGDVIEVIK